MAQVQIVSRLSAQLTDGSGVPKPAIAVTYSTAAIPPRTVLIPGEDPPEEAIADAIRADLAAAAAAEAATLEL